MHDRLMSRQDAKAADPRLAARCSLGARRRGDELLATAPPARRFFLLEVPGPWRPEAMAAAGLRPEVTAALQTAVVEAGARLLLIRRPGRHPADRVHPRRWGIAVPPGGLCWGEWRHDKELLDIDVDAAVSGCDPVEQLPLALVCTHGRHDLCCAIEGRPVAAVAAADPGVDAWECSHLGGDRFAANLLWLPSGLLFGGLGAADAGPVLAAARAGRVRLEHFRGRCGDAPPAQAAQWYLMRELGEDRPDRVVVESVEPMESPGSPGSAGSGLVAVVRHEADRYRLRLVAGRTDPAHLTCRAGADTRARTYQLRGDPVRL
jgi:hypothetical protein